MNFSSRKCFDSLSHPLILVLIILLIYGINPKLISLTEDASLLPFIIIFLASSICGYISSLIKLPPVFGMIISGIILSNFTNDVVKFNPVYSDIIRNIALSVLLVQAGMELDLKVLKSMSGIVIRLCFIPMVAEIIITSLTGYYILRLPIAWSIMLGLILSAACAALIVPVMIDAKQKNLGVDKGIPTIVTAACSMDDVFAIAGFGVTLGFAFPASADVQEHSLTWDILKAPVEVINGIVCGVIFGYICYFIPNPKDESCDNKLIRFVLIILGSLTFIIFFNHLDFPGSGPLGILVFAAVTGSKLRNNDCHEASHYVIDNCSKMWTFLSVFLFSLIGSDVKFENIDTEILFMIFIVILIGLIVRMITTYGCLLFGGLTLKEKLFISIAWVSKAAVQAAIGPTALTVARTRCKSGAGCEADANVYNAKVILTTSVLAVLICAPLGSIGMALGAPRLLTKSATTMKELDCVHGVDNKAVIETEEC